MAVMSLQYTRIMEVRDATLQVNWMLDAVLSDISVGRPVATDLFEVRHQLELAIGHPDDLHVRHLESARGVKVMVVAIDGLTESSLLDEFVLRAIGHALNAAENPAGFEQHLIQRGLFTSSLLPRYSIKQVVDSLFRGHAVVFIDGSGTAWSLDLNGFSRRTPDEPTSEPVIKGPREGFVEVLRSNTAAIRRRLATHRLRIENTTVGHLSRTRVAIMYVIGRADPVAVQRIRRKLDAVDLDTVVSVMQLEEYLEERPWSLFPTVHSTERPEVAAAALSEGSIIVALDGVPQVLIIPSLFWHFIAAAEDYFQRWPFATIIRGLRLMAVFIMLLALPVYVAATSFHQELLPTEFLLTIAASREAIPFSVAVEATLLNFGFDIIREASARMPRAIGGVVGLLGAVVIGEAAVNGGIVSAPMVIVIAVSAIAAFVVPSFSITIPLRILNYVLLLAAGSLGLFGVIVVITIVGAHIVSLHSHGVPFTAPVAPLEVKGMEDTLIRAPYRYQEGPPPLVGAPQPNEKPKPGTLI